MLTYLETQSLLATICDEVDEDWIDKFREWNGAVPVKLAEGAGRKRTPGTIEASVRQLAAVINFANAKKHILQGARFKPKAKGCQSHAVLSSRSRNACGDVPLLHRSRAETRRQR